MLQLEYIPSTHNWKKCPFTSQAEKKHPHHNPRGVCYNIWRGILIPQLKRSTPITTTTKYYTSIHRKPLFTSRLGPPYKGSSCAFQDGRLQCLSFQLRSGFQVFFHSQLRGCSLSPKEPGVGELDRLRIWTWSLPCYFGSPCSVSYKMR